MDGILNELRFLICNIDDKNIKTAYFHRNANNGNLELNIEFSEENGLSFNLVENLDIEEIGESAIWE